MKKYGKGWFLESQRHSLARQGVKTGRKINYSLVTGINYANEEISKEDFEAYVRVQKSGVTNMFDVKTVEQLSGLSRDKIFRIMKSYGGLSKKYKINYARQLSSSEFRIDDNATIIARAEKTSNGFRHIAEFYRNGVLVDTAKVTYLNRTWEKYEYQTAISKLLDKMGMSGDEKSKIMNTVENRALGKVDEQFKSVATVASLGDIFGKSEKEKNDWKLRMIKAGLGSKGFEIPEDWNTLSEEEKGKRLDKIIKFMRESSRPKETEV